MKGQCETAAEEARNKVKKANGNTDTLPDVPLHLGSCLMAAQVSAGEITPARAQTSCRPSLDTSGRSGSVWGMPRFIIHDQFADVPECAGHLALSIAFSQFLAVLADEDPFDRPAVEQKMRTASAVQEVLRWCLRLLQTEELRSYRKPIGGGPLSPMPSGHWHVDDAVERFITSQYNLADPFSSGGAADSWIFVSDEDFTHISDGFYQQLLTENGIKERRRRATWPMTAINDDAANSLAPAPSSPVASSPFGLLTLPQVEAAVGLAKSTIYKMISEGTFPEQLKLGSKSVWLRSDIEKWFSDLESRRGTSSRP